LLSQKKKVSKEPGTALRAAPFKFRLKKKPYGAISRRILKFGKVEIFKSHYEDF